MKSGFRYFCFVFVSLLATQVFAADMSGWSDKTVCRLVKAGGGQEHIDEATKRGLGCASPTVKSAAVSSSSTKVDPLDAIIVPQNWQPIKNQKIFDQERQIVKNAFAGQTGFYQKGVTVEYCFLDVMQNFEANMKVEVAKPKSADLYWAYNSPISVCSLAMAEQLSRLGTTPDYLQDMMLTWATDEVFKFPSENKPASEYQLRTYAMAAYLGVYGGYYAIYANEFDYNDEERKIVENYFAKQLIKLDISTRVPKGLNTCDFYSPSRLAKGLNDGKINVDNCGSPMLKSTTGAIALGLRLGDQDLFNAGIKNLKLLFRVFDKDGIFIPYAASRGSAALGYTSEIPLHLGALTELFDTVGYDFLEHVTHNGMNVKELLDAHIKVLNDPDMLLKYTATNGAYGGSGGDTVAMFNKLSLTEKWDYSNTGTKQVVRQSARYVDRFRPDLQEFRDQNYVGFDQHGYGIKSTDSHVIFDPYMLYVANNDITPYKMIDLELTATLSAAAEIQMTKAKKSNKVISLEWQLQHTIDGLVSWLKSIKWEGSLEDALSLDGSLGDDALADGEYYMHYMRVSNHTGKLGSRSFDKLTVLDGSIIFEALPRARIEPVYAQRKTIKFETNNGLIIATGNLQYELDDPVAEITFRGVIGTNFLIATTAGGRDIVMLHLKKR